MTSARLKRKERKRVARETRVTELLTGSTISLGAINEIAERQAAYEKADAGGGGERDGDVGAATHNSQKQRPNLRRSYDLAFCSIVLSPSSVSTRATRAAASSRRTARSVSADVI